MQWEKEYPNLAGCAILGLFANVFILLIGNLGILAAWRVLSTEVFIASAFGLSMVYVLLSDWISK